MKVTMRYKFFALMTLLFVVERVIAIDPATTVENPAEATSVPVQTGEGTQLNTASHRPDSQEGLPAPQGATAMPKPDRVWIDKKRSLVMVDGAISLREGYLEMFACTVGTKEHESVVAVDSRAQVVHAALLAIGVEPGHPVRFQPKFSPPAGPRIAIEVRWQDPQGKWQSVPAQQWILDPSTQKVLQQPWLFAGSGFWTDPATGKQYYQADAGDFICVSNFSTAMLDLPIESSQEDGQRAFVANTKLIPPLGTPVRLVMKVEEGREEVGAQ